MLDRHAEKEIFEIADRYKLGVITYSPLGEGLLTGKYRVGQSFPATSGFAMATKGGHGSRMTPAVMRLVDMLVGAAREHSVSPACLAVAWVLRRQQVSTVLVGPSRGGQVEDLLAAVDIDLAPSVTDGFDQLNEPSGVLTSYEP